MSITLPTPLDVMHLPAQFQGDVQTFLANNNNQNWQTWVKPRGVSMCYIIAFGGGGAGGAGFSRAAGNAGGGGGGGGGAGYTKVIVPAIFLPPEIYLQVGLGGLGGTGTGGNGSDTQVSLGRSTAAANLITSGNGGNGGTAGTGAAAGGGGSGGGSVTAPAFTTLGFFVSIAGAQGGAGGVQTGGNGSTPPSVWNNIRNSPGCGGAGCTTTDFAGGTLTLGSAPDYAATNVLGGTAGTGASAGGDGGGGIQLWEPFGTSGGSGGGSKNNGSAGSGGNGGISSGGGGGGAGNTGGRGGNGGNGMVVIISW